MRVYLLLGTNQGNRLNLLEQAEYKIRLEFGIPLSKSRIYETEPWGKTDQPSFLNRALCINSNGMHPLDFLKKIQKIELELGRQRTIHWGPRTMDIDILLWENEVINLPELTVPHKELPNRKFALLPLSEIVGRVQHPILKKSIAELTADCTDPLKVSVYSQI